MSDKAFGIDENSIRAKLQTGEYPAEMIARFKRNEKDFHEDHISMEVWAANGCVAGIPSTMTKETE